MQDKKEEIFNNIKKILKSDVFFDGQDFTDIKLEDKITKYFNFNELTYLIFCLESDFYDNKEFEFDEYENICSKSICDLVNTISQQL